MGNQGATPSSIGSQSGFKRYWIQMQRQPITDTPPYRNPELSYLKSLFQQLDTKKQKSIEVSDIDNYYALREHPLYERIRQIFRQQLEKLKGKRITYDIFLFLLSVFHIETPIEDKYRFILRYFRYLFRLYDVDGDLKVGVNDLVSIFEMIFYGPAYNHNVYQMMAEQLVAKHGTTGFIKLQQFIKMVPEDQVREFLTMKFLEL